MIGERGCQTSKRDLIEENNIIGDRGEERGSVAPQSAGVHMVIRRTILRLSLPITLITTTAHHLHPAPHLLSHQHWRQRTSSHLAIVIGITRANTDCYLPLGYIYILSDLIFWYKNAPDIAIAIRLHFTLSSHNRSDLVQRSSLWERREDNCGKQVWRCHLEMSVMVVCCWWDQRTLTDGHQAPLSHI